jgi:Protein of unknown function (DUF4038)/Putative collagen-binding domain of a collagenase
LFVKRNLISFLILIALPLAARAADGSQFPVTISANHRYLQDASGKPFFAQGDSPWSLISALTRDEAEYYLEDRRQKGFNALIVNLIERKFRGPVNAYGQRPFLTPGDFSTPNEKYFEHADWLLKHAAEKGFVVFLAPMYLGSQGTDEGWYQEALLNGDAKCREYGRYLGRRYKGYANVVWLMGGDRNPGQAWEMTDALAEGIRDGASGALFTAHARPEFSAAQQYGSTGWLDINLSYSYEVVHKVLLRDYSRRPVMPYVLGETTYENEHNASALQLRRQAYWAVLFGATGQFFGNKPIWGFDNAWRQALDARGSHDMAILAKLVARLPWWTLVPDIDHKAIVSGLGEFNGMDYLAAALGRERRIVLAYLPSLRTFTVDLSQLAGSQFRCSWFNPRNGEWILGEAVSSTGKADFAPPTEGDWVFLLEEQPSVGSHR